MAATAPRLHNPAPRLTRFTCKTRERYSIHALASVEPLLGPGFLTVRSHSDAVGDVRHLMHRSGVKVTMGALHDAYGSIVRSFALFGSFLFLILGPLQELGHHIF